MLRTLDEPRSRRRTRDLRTYSLLVLTALLLPVVYLFLRGGFVGQAVLLDFFTSLKTYVVVGRSLLLTLLVTVLAVLVALPAAYLTVRTDLKFRRIWTILLALPLVIPSYIGAFTMISAFGPRGSLLQEWLEPLGVSRLPSIYGWPGALLVLTLFTYPYIYLTVRTGLRSIDLSLEEAGRSLGHSRWSAFWRITVPQLVPAIGSGSLLVALYTLSDFGAVTLLRFDSFTRMIYVEYSFSFDRNTAALYSLVLVVLTVGILVFEVFLRGNIRSASRQRDQTHRLVELGPWQLPAQLFCGTVVFLGLALPAVVCLLWSLRGLWGDLQIQAVLVSAWTSFYLSGIAAVICLVVALPLCFFMVRSRGFSGKVVDRAVYVGYAVPGIVIGLALVFFASRWVPFLYQSVAILLFAYVIRFLSQSTGALRSNLEQLDPSLVEAGRSLGQSSFTIFTRVLLPLLKPGILSGAGLVFLTTMKELPATLLLRPTGMETLSIQIWQATDSAIFTLAGSSGIILIVISGGLMTLILKHDLSHGQRELNPS